MTTWSSFEMVCLSLIIPHPEVSAMGFPSCLTNSGHIGRMDMDKGQAWLILCSAATCPAMCLGMESTTVNKRMHSPAVQGHTGDLRL